MIMVHLWHPCLEIDIVYDVEEPQKSILVGQGYIALEDIRNVMEIPPFEDQQVNISETIMDARDVVLK